MLENNELGITL